MLSFLAFLASISASASGQLQGQPSIADTFVIPPLGDSSIQSDLTNTKDVDRFRPQRNAHHKPEINQQFQNISAPSAETLLNPPRNKEMVRSSMIVSGMMEAFMHKQRLQPAEKLCLEDSVSQVTADLVGTCQDVVDTCRTLTNFIAGKAGNGSSGTVTAVDAGVKLTYLVSSVANLLKTCVHGDAFRKLNAAAHHLTDMKYLGHRLVVSGVDIAKSLADSVISYERHHYHRFGQDIGTSLRKVFLSNSTRGALLPEGVPENEVIEQTSEGLLDGFFAGGSSIEITDSARPDVDIRLELHRCIGGNAPFFKEIFLSIWNAIAQFSVDGEQHGLQDAWLEGGSSPQWTDDLMLALMQMPSALERCDIGAETQSMLVESIQTLGQVHASIELPKGRSNMDQISRKMVSAVNYWSEWDFKKFGEELGVMLREVVLMVYPMKYSVSQSGGLQRQRSWSQKFERNPTGLAPGFLVLSIVGASFIFLIGLVVVRRSLFRPPVLVEEDVDAELASQQFIE